jgi:hypothetical protein
MLKLESACFAAYGKRLADARCAWDTGLRVEKRQGRSGETVTPPSINGF